jgi:hypothetical protein
VVEEMMKMMKMMKMRKMLLLRRMMMKVMPLLGGWLREVVEV